MSVMQKSDWDKLLNSISRGDESAFEELYKNSSKGVYAFLYSYLGNREDTEDALQEAYCRVRYNILHYKPGTDGRAWVLEIAKNVALNEVRRRKQTDVEPLEEERYGVTPFDGGERTSVTEAMRKVLTEDEQRIVVLHVLWGYKHREIAKLSGASTGTVTSKYKRAIDKLKSYLKEVKQ